MKRNYIAFYDTGHDYGCCPYTSEHKNKSKGNLEDAYITLKRKYGRHARHYYIYKTTKTDITTLDIWR